jgi:exodeoxyribonuclease VII large subunit
MRLLHQRLDERLRSGMTLRLETSHARLTQLARDLHTLSPLNTLARGYAIVSRERDGRIISAATEVELGESVKARLAEGSLVCQVSAKEK